MKLKQWKTVGEVGGKKRNVEYVYKSVEEVLEEGKFRKVQQFSSIHQCGGAGAGGAEITVSLK